MWAVIGNDLKMTEGDFGVELPITISGTTLTTADSVMFVLKNKVNGDTVLTKTYTEIQNNTFNLELTEAESALLPVGGYVYSIDWYQLGHFMCNIIPFASFKVGEKA